MSKRGPVYVTEEQFEIIAQATRRMRLREGNPLLGEAEALVQIAREYLKEATAPAPAETPGE